MGSSVVRRIGGRAIVAAGLVVGLGGGALAGIAFPSAPWIALLVAGLVALGLGAVGFVCSGEIVAAACPCCQTRTLATTWRWAFQCRRCQTMCALAALGRRRHLRSIPAGPAA